MINEAWSTKAINNNYFILSWIAMYCFGLIPSVLGLYPIYFVKTFISYYLAYDLWYQLITLEDHPAKEKEIWTLWNWALFPLRRWIVDFGLIFTHAFTQSIPIFNLILNFIPLFISFLNILVFWDKSKRKVWNFTQKSQNILKIISP